MGEFVFLFFIVTIVFPYVFHMRFSSCSQQHSQIALHFYPIWFAQRFNSCVHKVKRWAARNNICFYFATGGSNRCFYWGVPNVPKKLVMGQSILWPIQKTPQKKCEHTHEVIIMILQWVFWYHP